MAVKTAHAPLFQKSQSLTIASCAANTTNDQTFTVAGLVPGMIPIVRVASLNTGLTVTNAEVSATNTLKLRFANLTAAPIVPGAKTATIVCV